MTSFELDRRCSLPMTTVSVCPHRGPGFAPSTGNGMGTGAGWTWLVSIAKAACAHSQTSTILLTWLRLTAGAGYDGSCAMAFDTMVGKRSLATFDCARETGRSQHASATVTCTEGDVFPRRRASALGSPASKWTFWRDSND
jgi:hypothetical protein